MREISLTDEPLLTASALSRSSAIVRSVGTWAAAGSGDGVGRLAHGGGAVQRRTGALKKPGSGLCVVRTARHGTHGVCTRYGRTVQGSKVCAVAASIGTQTRPVLGWQHHGDLSK